MPNGPVPLDLQAANEALGRGARQTLWGLGLFLPVLSWGLLGFTTDPDRLLSGRAAVGVGIVMLIFGVHMYRAWRILGVRFTPAGVETRVGSERRSLSWADVAEVRLSRHDLALRSRGGEWQHINLYYTSRGTEIVAAVQAQLPLAVRFVLA